MATVDSGVRLHMGPGGSHSRIRNVLFLRESSSFTIEEDLWETVCYGCKNLYIFMKTNEVKTLNLKRSGLIGKGKGTMAINRPELHFKELVELLNPQI